MKANSCRTRVAGKKMSKAPLSTAPLCYELLCAGLYPERHTKIRNTQKHTRAVKGAVSEGSEGEEFSWSV